MFDTKENANFEHADQRKIIHDNKICVYKSCGFKKIFFCICQEINGMNIIRNT